MGLTIALDFDTAELVGVNAAIVHQQVAWWIKRDSVQKRAHKPGWFTGTSEEIADYCPFSAPAVRRAMTKLIEAGLMEKAKLRKTRGDQTLSYRPIELDGSVLVAPSDEIVKCENQGVSEGEASDEIDECTDDEIVRCTDDEIDECSNPFVDAESGYNPPLTPQRGESDEQQLPLGGVAPRCDKPKRSKRKRKRVDVDKPSPRFDALWANWPNKADRKDSKRAWLTRTEIENVDPDRLDRAVANYVTAVQMHEVETGAKPSLLHGATFLNGRWERFETDASPDPAWPKQTGPSRAVTPATEQQKQLSHVMADLVLAAGGA